MITWGDVVEITLDVFGINQTQLAEIMRCNKGVITRIKQGEQPPSPDIKTLFSLVFDTAESNGPASVGRRTPQYWLDVVKEVIESKFKEVREDMEDCWNEKDYQIFVLTLLERARKGASSKKKPQRSNDSGETSAIANVLSASSDNTPAQEATPPIQNIY